MSDNVDLLRHARQLMLHGHNQRAVALLREHTPALDREAVGIITGLDPSTITRYLDRSGDGGPYADDPFPAPTVSAEASVWAPERAPELLGWRARHADRDAGHRRPWPERTATPANAAAKPSRGRRSPQ